MCALLYETKNQYYKKFLAHLNDLTNPEATDEVIIEALKKVFGKDIDQSDPIPNLSETNKENTPLPVTSITIYDDLCYSKHDKHFTELTANLSSLDDPVLVLESLNYLSKTILRDCHRYSRLLCKHADRLLLGCVRQLNNFIKVEYRFLLESEPDLDQINRTRVLLDTLASTVAGLIHDRLFSASISVSTYSALFTALLEYYTEEQFPQSRKHCSVVLNLICDNHALFIDSGCYNYKAPNLFEGLFESIYSFIVSCREQDSLTALQWRKLQVLSGYLDERKCQIMEDYELEPFLRQVNQILLVYPESPFQSERDFRLLDIIARFITEKLDRNQRKGQESFKLETLEDPVGQFARMVYHLWQINSSNKPKQSKSKTVMIEFEPHAPLEIIVEPLDEPVKSFHHVIDHLTSTTDEPHANMFLQYLNQNLDDFVVKYPSDLCPDRVNQLVGAITRQYQLVGGLYYAKYPLYLDQVAPALYRRRQHFLDTITALLKRIFAHPHLIKSLCFERIYPKLVLTTATLSSIYVCGERSIRTTLFERDASIQLGSRLRFCIRMLRRLLELQWQSDFGASFTSICLESFFVKAIKRMVPAVNVAMDQMDKVMTELSAFAKLYDESYWTITIDIQKSDQYFHVNKFPSSTDVIRHLLRALCKHHGPSMLVYLPRDQHKLPLGQFVCKAVEGYRQIPEYVYDINLEKLPYWNDKKEPEGGEIKPNEPNSKMPEPKDQLPTETAQLVEAQIDPDLVDKMQLVAESMVDLNHAGYPQLITILAKSPSQLVGHMFIAIMRLFQRCLVSNQKENISEEDKNKCRFESATLCSFFRHPSGRHWSKNWTRQFGRILNSLKPYDGLLAHILVEANRVLEMHSESFLEAELNYSIVQIVRELIYEMTLDMGPAIRDHLTLIISGSKNSMVKEQSHVVRLVELTLLALENVDPDPEASQGIGTRSSNNKIMNQYNAIEALQAWKPKHRVKFTQRNLGRVNSDNEPEEELFGLFD